MRGNGFEIEAAKGIFTGKLTYDTVMKRIYDIPLRANKNYNYSCLNFCLLMDIEQRVTGKSHDVFMTEQIFGPVGAYRTGYRPLTWTDASNVAPTEHDRFLRKQVLLGHVHDELAAFSGGVQGNAGLLLMPGILQKYARCCSMAVFTVAQGFCLSQPLACLLLIKARHAVGDLASTSPIPRILNTPRHATRLLPRSSVILALPVRYSG